MGGNEVDGTVRKGVVGTKALFGANKLDGFVDGLAKGFLGAIAGLAGALLANSGLSPAKGTKDMPVSLAFC
jgi:uncharacterized membrane protein